MDIETIVKAVPYFETYPQWAKYALLSSFVVCASSIVVFLVALFLGYRAGDVKVTINKPPPDAPVAWEFPVEATVQNVPSGYQLWVMTTANNKYWPQERIVQGEGDTWVGRVRNLGGAPGTKQSFGVFLVGQNGQALIELWKRGSSQISNFKDYDIRFLTSDMKPLAERQVLVASGEPGK